jgi:tRNA G37 N-methylase TrmD
LVKAKPIIDTIEHIISNNDLSDKNFRIIYLSPSKKILNQKLVVSEYKNLENIILVC